MLILSSRRPLFEPQSTDCALAVMPEAANRQAAETASLIATVLRKHNHLTLRIRTKVGPATVPRRRPGTRDGKRAVAFWIDAADYEDLRVAALRARMTVQVAGEAMLAAWMEGQGVRLPGR